VYRNGFLYVYHVRDIKVIVVQYFHTVKIEVKFNVRQPLSVIISLLKWPNGVAVDNRRSLKAHFSFDFITIRTATKAFSVFQQVQ